MARTPDTRSARLTCRNFIGALGAGALTTNTFSPISSRVAHAQTAARRPVIREDRFGRMFPDLPPFASSRDRLLAALRDIGKPGGLLDAKDNLSAGRSP